MPDQQEQSTLWAEILALLEHEFPEQHVNIWLRPLQALEDGGSLRLMAPNRFAVDWVQANAADRIRACCVSCVGPDMPVVGRDRLAAGGLRHRRARAASHRAARRAEPNPPAVMLASRLNPDATFELFVEGKSNHFAKAAAMQVAENPGKAYNPLFIYGGTGLGKTHLMQAVGHVIKERDPDARVAYVHSERFVDDMVQALRHNTHERVQERVSRAVGAADRRHPVLRQQGPLAGRVLPHLQRAVRRPEPDHPDLGSLSEGNRRAGRAAEVALRLGTVGGHRAAGTRDLRGAS